MGCGKSPNRRAEAEEETGVEPPREAFPSSSLAASPVMLFVFFHKAFRGELAELHQVAEGLAEGCCPEVLVGFRERFEFLKLVYSYHSAVEDEVIFLSLDSHVENVACTYSLEHRRLDELFDSFFQTVDALLEDGENNPKAYQELLFSLCTIQTSICKHMLKEEKQVFPLLLQQFSQEEQAALVWQFLCSVPVMLLEDFLPWMISFHSQEEQEHIVSCVKEVVPKEEPLQEVIAVWLSKNNQPSSSVKRIQKLLPPSRISSREKLWPSKEDSVDSASTDDRSPLSWFTIWHGAIRKDLEATLQELYLLRSSGGSSSLPSVVIQLKFLADVLTFYSNALDRFFYPVLTELSSGCEVPPADPFLYKRQIESLQQFLHNTKSHAPRHNVIHQLCYELESWIIEISEFFTFHETEVFDPIRNNCSHEVQQQLLYSCIRTLPLGLLKCAITWFSTHLTQQESTSIVHIITPGDSSVDKPFTSLLHEWFRIASSGKTSLDKFRRDLQEIFKGRLYFLSEQVEHEKGSNLKLTETENNDSSLHNYPSVRKLDMPYSSGINLHVFFPITLRPMETFPMFQGENSNSVPASSRPIDIIFYFHKAFKNDLERLILDALHLTENAEFLKDFCERFRLIKLFYQVHSDAEDDIAFPALEAKGDKVQNISHSYTIDHKLEVKHLDDISALLDKMSDLHASSRDSDLRTVNMRHRKLGMELQNMCRSMQKVLSDHIHHEEIEIWPLFRECFPMEEQEKIIGCMLGRTRAEILQDMIPWLLSSLSLEEHQAMMSSWRRVARNTMFDEWLREWWEGYEHDVVKMEKSNQNVLSILETKDPMEIISCYLSKDILNEYEGNTVVRDDDNEVHDGKLEDEGKDDQNEPKLGHSHSEGAKLLNKIEERNETGKCSQAGSKSRNEKDLSETSQEELEAAIRKVSRDSSLDSQKKSYIIQNLLMSRWIIAQKKSDSASLALGSAEEVLGQSPSYRDPVKLTYGCKHYRRNCKLLAECCNQLYTCRRCHDEDTDHTLDRKAITKMMCMKCLVIQPIGPICTTTSCDNLSMGRYYCRICKIYEDEREIYHCPYCNLCRLGKGLGIDYFHCMNCNACMSRSLTVHICREKCLEDNCPICHEYIFTSCSPVKSLPCGHLMHSTCFQDYTFTHYTCPICSKSLGDMQVYFQMLDTLMAEEKMPEEYSGKTQVILCNDCEKRGSTPFHWLYHKCPHCGSYNTRLL